jgi:Na+-transporting methylmalonyl-CoA/oxaloacetate decarboxylase gamma subunit
LRLFISAEINNKLFSFLRVLRGLIIFSLIFLLALRLSASGVGSVADFLIFFAYFVCFVGLFFKSVMICVNLWWKKCFNELKNSGAEEGRTPDLLNAIQALSQLSYGPG